MTKVTQWHLLLAFILAVATADDKKPANVAADACKLARVLQSIATQLEGKLQPAAATISGKKPLIARLIAAAGQGSAKINLLAAPVLLKLATAVTSAESKLKTLTAKTTALAAKLRAEASRALAITEAVSVQVKTTDTGDTNAGTLDAGDNIQFTEIKTGAEACAATLAKAAHNAAAWIHPENLKTMVFYRLKINAQGSSARLPTLGKGASGGAQCTNTVSVPTGGNFNSNLCIAGGPILKEDKQTHTADEAGKYITSVPTDEEKAADPGKNEKGLAQELLDVAQEWHTANFNFDALEISSYTTDDTFKAAVAAAVGNLKEPYDLTKHEEIISRLISSKYCHSKETFNNKFWEPLSKLPVPKVALGTDSDGTVAQISDTATAAKVLLQAAKQRQSKTEKRAANTAGEKPEGDAKTDTADKTGDKKDGDNTDKPLCSSI
uniref:Variant surface glycoprotein 1305 n=1 Tax=Trypanosoma brucei TaxID=5691 RepID=M4SV47_9TRYP|nr:variant surface glycoprotein 1305 [Trypanosoma brucei]